MLQNYVLKIKTDVQCISLDAMDFPPVDPYIYANFNGEEIAFLQSTSGSTSSPKGVFIEGFDPEQILKDIRKNIMKEYGIQPYAIYFN